MSRGAADHLTTAELVTRYRRATGLRQRDLAALAGVTEDYISKLERGLRRPSIGTLGRIAAALRRPATDLLALPTQIPEGDPDAGEVPDLPALRDVLLIARPLSRLIYGDDEPSEPPRLEHLNGRVWAAWADFQGGRVARLATVLPALIEDAETAAREYTGDDRQAALDLQAVAYHAACQMLLKVGENDLAYLAIDRALSTADAHGDPAVLSAAARGVAQTLSGLGRHKQALTVVDRAAERIEDQLGRSDPKILSIYGALSLKALRAAALIGDEQRLQTYLREAVETGRRLGWDANMLGTGFGPTNVRIHEVEAYVELGKMDHALALGLDLDLASLPIERRVEHWLTMANALTHARRYDEAAAMLLRAERGAPQRVRAARLAKVLAQDLLKLTPQSTTVAEFASRIGAIDT